MEIFMKLIHCADLHLDSRLQTHLDRDRAKRQRDELLRNFARLADYARENGVEAVLIAGDLFDRDTVSALAKNTVLSVIASHPEIRFYYLRGNHDTGDCLGSGNVSAEVPVKADFVGQNQAAVKNAPFSNLYMFGSRWKSFPEGKDGRIRITGIELTPENSASAGMSLHLDPDDFNIVMLHGQETAAGTGTGREPAAGGAGTISLRALRGRGIDYLALGHIHAFRAGTLDSRGIYCYPGCLEGRGFDECGPRGFVELDIDEKKRTLKRRFVPFARRTLYALKVDVAGCMTTAQMNDLVESALRETGCSRRDMADVTLVGDLDVNCEKDIAYILNGLKARLFFARVTDATTLHIDPDDYLYDESLRGEFVRLVMADSSISGEDKAAVIRCGFQAMDGGEIIQQLEQ